MTTKAATLGRLDGRTREAKLLRAIRADLTLHVGGAPSATQSALIEQAAQIKLRLAKMDRSYAETGEMSDHASRTYLAWANSYSRLLLRIGIKSAAERAPDFSTRLAQKIARRAEATAA